MNRIARRFGVRSAAVFGVVIFMLSMAGGAETAPDGIVHVSGSYAGQAWQDRLAEAYSDLLGRRAVVVSGCRNSEGMNQLGLQLCDVLVFTGPLREQDRAIWYRAWPKAYPQPAKYTIGRQAVLVIVNKANPVKSLTVDQLAAIFSGKFTRWGEVSPEAVPGRNIVCVGQPNVTNAHYMFSERVLKGLPFGEQVRQAAVTGSEVRADVAKEAGAIGFLLYEAELDLSSVNVVGICAKESEPVVHADIETVFEDIYPICSEVSLYLHPKAPREAKRYCDFARSEAAAKIAKEFYMFHVSDYEKVLAKRRADSIKDGKGIHVSAIGIGGGGTAAADLAVDYARARAAVQMGYLAVESDVAAVSAFLRVGSEESTSRPVPLAHLAAPAAVLPSSMPASLPTSLPATMPAISPFVSAGGKELLFLDDKPSEQAMKLYGEKWNALGRDEDGKPDGSGPKEYVLAGRAVAIVVNPSNKIEALTLEQIRSIFGGQVEDWNIVGGAGLGGAGGNGGAAGAAAGKVVPQKINCVGIQGGAGSSGNAAAGVFYKELLPADKFKRVSIKKDTAEVVAAVSMDPAAIGFVDLSALPGGGLVGSGVTSDALAAAGQTVKVLGIRIGTGERARVVLPTADNIKSAMYVPAQRVYLYVHPQASDTAKDFAKFIATCGGSEATPYADTVASVMEAYRKNGLIPLAEEAIVRATKDALASAAAKAREATTRPATKG